MLHSQIICAPEPAIPLGKHEYAPVLTSSYICNMSMDRSFPRTKGKTNHRHTIIEKYLVTLHYTKSFEAKISTQARILYLGLKVTPLS